MDKALTDQYAVLDKALPGFKAPDKLADSKDLEAAIDAIRTTVSQTLNIDLEVHRTAAEVIAASRTGLLDALDYYGKGQADQAYEAASSAYLDNYETLEVPLRKKDADLTNLLEKQMVDFGKMIKDGKPIDDLKALYAQIDVNLSKAQDLLTTP